MSKRMKWLYSKMNNIVLIFDTHLSMLHLGIQLSYTLLFILQCYI